MRKEREEAGFTLIELMIVMSIIAVLSASIIPIWKVYQEKALVTRAQEGARCLQTSLIALDTVSVEERTATIHNLGGSAAEFHQEAENLGCRLGPSAADLKAQIILEPDDCRVVICAAGVRVREVGCNAFDERHLAAGEVKCGMYQICRIPNVPRKDIVLSDNTIEVRTIQ